MDEIWKPVVGYEGLYEVSNYGNIRSVEKIDALGHKRKCKPLKAEITNDGYLRFTLYKNGISIHKSAHRIVYEAFIGEIPNGFDIHHKNHIRNDNNVENLELKLREEHGKEHYLEKGKKMISNIRKKCSKPIRCIETGIVYSSARELERELGYFHQAVCGCCKGKYQMAYGYHWEYLN